MMRRVASKLGKVSSVSSRSVRTNASLYAAQNCRVALGATAGNVFPRFDHSSFRSISVRSLSTKPEKMEFKAETRKLLDIVTHSIYTDKEVFLRELISNASDALEKYRYKQVLGEVRAQAGPLEINILLDKEKKTIIVSDNGIGMSRDELVANLGTIARSGSKEFVNNISNAINEAEPSSTNADKHGIIGQFGVGFYASFMVSDSVRVQSVSSSTADHEPHEWYSDGSGEFFVNTLSAEEQAAAGEGFQHGTRVVMSIKDTCIEFLDIKKIKDIITRYSNFVAFPIKLNGEAVNTVSALWTEEKSKVTTEQYKDFYKFIANAYDEPKYTLHFRTDAPIDLKALLFIPTFHSEKFGQARMNPGVNLYSKKVLIESKPRDLLPDWLRFVKGVVDSEDLPLSLSREKPQDSNLIRRIRDVLTRKLIRHLEDQSKENPVEYKEFYLEYGYFLKEGVCHDAKFVDQISKLLLFESSAKSEGDLISLDDYISRCSPEQKEIFYIVAPSRTAALASPYYETFKKHNQEVLFLYNAVDDFVMGNIKSYAGRALVSAETSSIDLDARNKDKKDETKDEAATTELSETESKELCSWLNEVLGGKRVREVKTTFRLSGSPAIVTDHESGALRRMQRMLEQSRMGEETSLPPQVLEINPKHPIIINLHNGMKAEGESAKVSKLVAEQMFDNALIAAGLVDDPRAMLSRLNEILLATFNK